MRKEAPLPRDERFMRRAVRLAARGIGETNPNPAVGCVLVKDGVVVGEGFHARAGDPHAEALALEDAGARARGATAYVTLEPCAPHPRKRTPPCGPRLIEAGVRRVVIGARDWNPSVRGASVRRLRAAGIEVSEGVGAGEAGILSQHFNLAMRQSRPFVALKTGMTLDGRTATSTGESQWITSMAQRTAARRLRRLFDGVVIGVGTALGDDPRLLPRPLTKRPFFRIVLDSSLRLPPDSLLARTARRSPVLVLCVAPALRRRNALERQGVVVVPLPNRGGRVSISGALDELFSRGMRSVLVEGGAEVLGSFVAERMFDELVMFRAPIVLGGRGSLPVVGGENPARLSEAVPVRRSDRASSATLTFGLGRSEGLEVEVFERRGPARTAWRRGVA